MPLSSALRAVAKAHPEALAVSADGVTRTYAQIETWVARVAAGLRDRYGLKPGDRVALFSENTGDYLPLMFAIWRAGLSAVPINAKLHAKEFAWIAENAQIKLAIVSPDLADTLTPDTLGPAPIIVTGSADDQRLTGYDSEIVDAPYAPSAEAWLFYTSGTTGRPKGAMLTHRNLLFACHAYTADIDWLDTRDSMVHAAPLSHGSGLYGLAHMIRGSHQIVLDGFDPAAIFDALSRHENVSMFAAPTMVKRLVEHPRAGSTDARHLKCIIYGGAPMYVADLEAALRAFGPRLYQLYGQGESPMTITGLTKAMHADTAHPRWRERLASTGVARTGVAYRIVDDAGRKLPDGEIGEVVTKSDCVMASYWANDDANAKALRDGWLWTGDVGSRDADGFLTLRDRSKDLIICGGSNIYPREIEEVLLRHPGVAECAVIEQPHAEWGEEVVAVVVPRTGFDAPSAADLDALCLANIARFKRPKSYRFVDVLPKNNYGKVLKTDLRAAITRLPRA